MSNGRRPWEPGPLRGRDDLDRFIFVVVEEKIDDTIGLVASMWPSVGENGVPRFDEPIPRPRWLELTEERPGRRGSLDLELAVPRDQLERELAGRQLSGLEGVARPDESTIRELQERPVVVGDVFAIRTYLDIAEGRPILDEPPVVVIDITAEAREAAKAAMHSALTPPLDQQLIDELLGREEAGGEIA